MHAITDDQTVYDGLLASFKKTLVEASRDDANEEIMTDCEKEVVDFDAFTKNRSLGWNGSPLSCDALYLCNKTGAWFLIEFKNGTLENAKETDFRPRNNEFYGVVRKIFESLLLFTEKLRRTIEFTRNNLVFILVYNEEKNKNLKNCGLQKWREGITKWGHKNDILQMCHLSEILPQSFNVAYFDKLYVKRAYICSKALFESEFVKKYMN